MKSGSFLGGVLFIVGTSVGAGILAIPVTTGFMGFFPSLLLFAVCWCVMLVSALFLVDVNCGLPGEANLITMARKTVGPWGEIVGWMTYLLLLYALIAAYIAASSPLFTHTFFYVSGGHVLPSWIPPFCLPCLFGPFVYLGTRGADVLNRCLMVGMGIFYCTLIVTIAPNMQLDLLTHVDWRPIWIAFPILITAFGYHIIIPTLATYFRHDRKEIIRCVIVGSVITLLINIIWQGLVLGIVPVRGSTGLAQAWIEGSSSISPLSSRIDLPILGLASYFFLFFAVTTSFLGVALSLCDFLRDGLQLKKTWEGRLMAILLTFFPPLVFVFAYQRGFLVALDYAGAFVAVLLIFLPSVMAWTLRRPRIYRTKWMKGWIGIMIAFSFLIVCLNALIQAQFFQPLMDRLCSH